MLISRSTSWISGVLSGNNIMRRILIPTEMNSKILIRNIGLMTLRNFFFFFRITSYNVRIVCTKSDIESQVLTLVIYLINLDVWLFPFREILDD